MLAVAIAMTALCLAPAAGAAHVSPASTPSSASHGTWSWGSFENLTAYDQFYGSYANALGLTSANLSQGIDDVAEVVGSHAIYGSFSVLNATSPSNATRSIHLASIWEYNYTGGAIVNGTLPKAGTYAAGQSAPLVNVTAVWYEQVIELSAYVAYANYTWTNGSLALVNEHFEVAQLVNESIIVYHWPGYYNYPNGTVLVTSTTYGYRYLSWVAESFSASFSPAVPVVKAPVSVGENWTANTTAVTTGWETYSTASAYSIGPTNTSSYSAGGTSLNTTAALKFAFAVTSSEEIVFPNGTTATGYVLDATESTSGTTTYVVWDGLAIVPSTEAPSAPAPQAPPALARAGPLTGSSIPTTEAVVAGSGFPVATNSAVSSSEGMSSAPLPNHVAQAQIQTAGTPSAPTKAKAPTVTGPPTLPGSPGTTSSSGGNTGTSTTTTGTGSSSTTPPANSGTTPAPGGTTSPAPGTTTPPGPGPKPLAPTPAAKKALALVNPWFIAAALGGIAVAFLGIEASRRRRPL